MSLGILLEYVKNFETFLALAKSFDANSVSVTKQDGEWSPAYVIHHVADAEMHFAIRYFNALTIEKPSIIPFNEDAYPSVLNYAGRDWKNSLAIIESIANLVQVTLTPLSASEWEKISVHPEAGEVTVSFLIGKANNHMAAHVEQLKGLM